MASFAAVLLLELQIQVQSHRADAKSVLSVDSESKAAAKSNEIATLNWSWPVSVPLSDYGSRDWSEYVNVIGASSEPCAVNVDSE